MAMATTRWACASRSSSPRSTTTRSTRSGGSTSRSPRPRRATSKLSPSCRPSGCRSPPRVAPLALTSHPRPPRGIRQTTPPRPTPPRLGAPTDGQDLATRQAGAPAKVQDTCIYSLQPLRSPALGVPQVRPLPYLLARAGTQRADTGDDQVLLVGAPSFRESLQKHFRSEHSMSMTDPIADFLTRIRNAIHAAHETVDIPASTLKAEIARILVEQGYIDSWAVLPARDGATGQLIQIRLKYTDDRRSAISGLRRVSRPGRRTYVEATGIPKVLGGMGTSIVSTSRGVMTGHDARAAGVGGEVLAQVW